MICSYTITFQSNRWYFITADWWTHRHNCISVVLVANVANRIETKVLHKTTPMSKTIWLYLYAASLNTCIVLHGCPKHTVK